MAEKQMGERRVKGWENRGTGKATDGAKGRLERLRMAERAAREANLKGCEGGARQSRRGDRKRG